MHQTQVNVVPNTKPIYLYNRKSFIFVSSVIS